MAVRVCVQQRERLFREGLGQLLHAHDDVELVGTARTGDDLVTLCEQARPDVALLEVDAPEWNPARIGARIRRRLPRVDLIGVYAALTVAEARLIRQAGIPLLLSRREGIVPIIDAVCGIRRPRSHRPEMVDHADAAQMSLTPREVAVLTLVGGGHTSREISAQLQISHKTVENHKQRIFGKLGVQNQAHAVAVAMRNGTITPEQAIAAAFGA